MSGRERCNPVSRTPYLVLDRAQLIQLLGALQVGFLSLIPTECPFPYFSISLLSEQCQGCQGHSATMVLGGWQGWQGWQPSSEGGSGPGRVQLPPSSFWRGN